MEISDCTSLEKKIRTFSTSGHYYMTLSNDHGHVPPSVLRPSDNFDKPGNGSYVFSVSLV